MKHIERRPIRPGRPVGLWRRRRPVSGRSACCGCGIHAGGRRNLQAAAFVSADSGKTFTQVTTIPAGTRRFRGVGLINNTDALLVGDSSAVIRFNATTGASTLLGAAEGIPQRTVDAVGAITPPFQESDSRRMIARSDRS